jgi:hypothetical protein
MFEKISIVKTKINEVTKFLCNKNIKHTLLMLPLTDDVDDNDRFVDAVDSLSVG